MHKVVESSSFQDIETRSKIDMKDVLSKAYTKNAVAAGKGGNSQDLKGALSQLLSKNVATLDPEVVKGAKVSDEIELMLNVD